MLKSAKDEGLTVALTRFDKISNLDYPIIHFLFLWRTAFSLRGNRQFYKWSPLCAGFEIYDTAIESAKSIIKRRKLLCKESIILYHHISGGAAIGLIITGVGGRVIFLLVDYFFGKERINGSPTANFIIHVDEKTLRLICTFVWNSFKGAMIVLGIMLQITFRPVVSVQLL